MTTEAAHTRPSRFTSNLYVRCPAVLPAAVESAAQRLCMTASEYVRRSVVERLSADGFNPAQIASHDAGALYDSVNGKQRYALVTDAGAILAIGYHHAKPEAGPDDRGRVWLPVVHEDSEPFDISTHWRLAPITRIDPDRVVVTFPVVPKSLEAM